MPFYIYIHFIIAVDLHIWIVIFFINLQKTQFVYFPFHKIGSLDLGGGSTQIAFSRDDGSLYAASFAKFGVNEARYRYYRLLRDSATTTTTTTNDVDDPCMPHGAMLNMAEVEWYVDYCIFVVVLSVRFFDAVKIIRKNTKHS